MFTKIFPYYYTIRKYREKGSVPSRHFEVNTNFNFGLKYPFFPDSFNLRQINYLRKVISILIINFVLLKRRYLRCRAILWKFYRINYHRDRRSNLCNFPKTWVLFKAGSVLKFFEATERYKEKVYRSRNRAPRYKLQLVQKESGMRVCSRICAENILSTDVFTAFRSVSEWFQSILYCTEKRFPPMYTHYA